MLNATKAGVGHSESKATVCNTERYLQKEEWGEERVLGKGSAGKEKVVVSQGSKPIQGWSKEGMQTGTKGLQGLTEVTH